MTSETLPQLGDCVESYLNLWEAFEADTFSTSDVLATIPQQNANSPLIPGNTSEQLDWLVAYGLLEQLAEDRYRVRCRPDEDQLDWWEHFEDRIATLHDAVTETREASDTASHPIIAYRGDDYVSVFVDEDTELADVVAELDAADDMHAGVALRSPATIADAVQHLADDLCSFDNPHGAFEKVNSEVKGTDSGNLEFRLYLTPRGM